MSDYDDIASVDPRRDNRVIRDPAHDYIDLPLRLHAVVDHPMAQRLRRISQTSVAQVVYPGMTGMRFEHCLGVMHLASIAWENVWSNSAACHRTFKSRVRRAIKDSLDEPTMDEYTAAWATADSNWSEDFATEVAIAVQAAAFLHDCGHPPYSHALEPLFEKYSSQITAGASPAAKLRWSQICDRMPKAPFHERATIAILDLFPSAVRSAIPWWLVRKILEGGPPGSWESVLHAIISSEIDVDRMDYIYRDALKSGTEFGILDQVRLLSSMEMHLAPQGGFDLGFGLRAMSALESFLLARVQYYRWMLHHPHVVAANKMLALAVERILNARQGQRPETFQELNYWLPSAPFDVERSTRYGVSPHEQSIDKILQAAEIDDGSIDTLLKAGRRGLAPQQSNDGTMLFQARNLADEFLALHEAVMHREPNWASAWKTDLDYSSAADEIVPAISANLKAEAARIIGEARARPGGMTGAESQAIALIGAWTDLLDAAPQGGCVVALNNFAHALLGQRDKVAAGPREAMFSRQLTVQWREKFPKYRWSWIVSRSAIDVSSDALRDVHVYEGETQHGVMDVSAIVRGLQVIESAHGHLYAYVLATDGTQLREGRRSVFGTEVESFFQQAVPVAAAALFGSLVSAVPQQV